jgi:hypothetical protein
MDEYQAAVKIRAILEKDKTTLAEIPIMDMIMLWYKDRRFTDVEFTDKLLEFCKKYGFGYIVILGHKRQGIAVRFWLKEEPVLLEEKHGDTDTDA